MATVIESQTGQMPYETVLDGTDDEAVNLEEVFQEIRERFDEADRHGRKLRLILREE